MSYTAEQLRAKARNLRELGRQLAADDCEAHADALEENARLRANRDFWHEACEQAQQHRDSANEQLAIADAEIAKLKDEQARAAKIVEGVEGSVGSGAAAMTYTAWDYRKLAEYHEQLGNAIIAKHYLAHADALEENARLTRECEFHAKQCARVDELRHRAEAELAKLRGRIVAADAHLRFVAEYREQYEAWPCVEAISGSIKCARDILRADFPEEK